MRVRLLLAGLVAVVAAGCGSAGSKELSPSEYQQQVSNVLVKTHGRFQLDPGASLNQLVPQLDAGAAAYADAVQQLRDLKPPVELQSSQRELLNDLAAVRSRLRASAADARGGRTRAMLADLGGLATAENRLTALLRRIDRAAA